MKELFFAVSAICQTAAASTRNWPTKWSFIAKWQARDGNGQFGNELRLREETRDALGLDLD